MLPEASFASLSVASTFYLSSLFFGVLLLVLIENGFRMFFKRRHGRTHAFTGILYLCLLIASFFEAFFFHAETRTQMLLDCLVGVCGAYLAFSAAEDFGHKNVVNSASGTLDAHATVTHAEMMEHVFYQGVNLVQILFLHSIQLLPSNNQDTSTPLDQDLLNPGPHYDSTSPVTMICRAGLAVLATSIWLLRGRFPVHSFSANYKKHDPRSSALVRFLYRLKKYQYLLYKHCLLHGLNISVVLSGACLTSDPHFRVYWLLLNTSYVMEFFLQTLVKKEHMGQGTLLSLQGVLMLASSLAAFKVLLRAGGKSVGVLLVPAATSLVLNLAHRGHEVLNFSLVLLLAGLCNHFLS